jgi:hypothetical protein
MKKIFALLTLAGVTLLGNFTAAAQTNALVTNLLNQAQAASDSKLGTIAAELISKLEAFEAAGGTNAAETNQINSLLQSLASGQDSTALTSAYKLATAAKLTPEQLTLAKQVGNLASAYVVQKDFASLDGSQNDVATIVNSLRTGQVATAAPALENVLKNGNLTDSQKQLLSTVADKYAPGWKKASGMLNDIKSAAGLFK